MMEPDPHRALSMEEVVRTLYKILLTAPRPAKSRPAAVPVGYDFRGKR